MSPFFEVKHYTREEVEELLRISMTDELNIFHNRNKIITNLCRTLLKVWEDRENLQ
tara:strand:+ start:2100 stop:2267 length:168 start_codon:yes stop_codon:yes gene_type:complete